MDLNDFTGSDGFQRCRTVSHRRSPAGGDIRYRCPSLGASLSHGELCFTGDLDFPNPRPQRTRNRIHPRVCYFGGSLYASNFGRVLQHAELERPPESPDTVPHLQ